MFRILFSTIALAALPLTASAAPTVFVCNGVSFNIYADGPNGGILFMGDKSVSQLDMIRADQDTWNASIPGNYSSTQFILEESDASVYVVDSSGIEKFCDALMILN